MNITKFLREVRHYLPDTYLTIFICGALAAFYSGLAFFYDDSFLLSLTFFGLSVLFCTTIFSEFLKPLIGRINQLQTELQSVNRRLSDVETATEQAKKYIEFLGTIKQRPGFIYIMRRDDGVIKIGRSINVENRLKQHETDYERKFTIIETFVVPDTITFEYLALSMTVDYYFLEPHRNELRSMSNHEIDKFRTVFTAICKEAVALR